MEHLLNTKNISFSFRRKRQKKIDLVGLLRATEGNKNCDLN